MWFDPISPASQDDQTAGAQILVPHLRVLKPEGGVLLSPHVFRGLNTLG